MSRKLLLLAGYVVLILSAVSISAVMGARILAIVSSDNAVQRPAKASQPAAPAPPASGRPAPLADGRAPEDLPFGKVWTDRPVRVDPAAQPFPVIEPPPRHDPFPEIVSFPRNVRVVDNASFAFAGKSYRLAGVRQVEPNLICTDGLGRRWACGARARVFLRNAIAGDTFRCRLGPLPADGTPLPLDCQVTATTTLSGRVVAAGWGEPEEAASDELKRLFGTATSRGFGFWTAQ